MFLQLLSVRNFTVSKKDVIKVVRGGVKNDVEGNVTLTPKTIVELQNAKAKKLLKHYPNEFEPWGEDAMAKQPVKKGKTSQQNKGHQGRDIV